MGLSFMDWFRRKKPKPPPPVPPKPAPDVKPVPIAGLRMGASVFCGHETPRSEYGAVPGVQCPNENPWSVIVTGDRKMAISDTYNEADPSVTLQRLKWMGQAKLNFCSYQIDIAHEHTQPSKMRPGVKSLLSPLIYTHCIDAHPPTSPIEHFASTWDASAQDKDFWQALKANDWTAEDVVGSHAQYARLVAERYMGRPNYMHVRGRPVMMRGHPHLLETYRSLFGIEPKEIIQRQRDVVRDVTGKDPYLIATAVEPAFRPLLKSGGFAALTEYLLHGDGWDNAMRSYAHWNELNMKQCRADGMDYWIPASAGHVWGAAPYPNMPPDHKPTPAQFTAQLVACRAMAEKEPELTQKIVISYAWNELHEGGTMEPMQPNQLHDGDAMIRAHAAACT